VEAVGMIWSWFPLVAIVHMACVVAAGVAVVRNRNGLASILAAMSVLVLSVFVGGIWIDMGRPPLRTYGETRLAYALGLGVLSLSAHRLLRQSWTLLYGGAMAGLFVALTWAIPESHSRALMPALRSPWFVPHVTVYLLGYAAATATSIAALLNLRKPATDGRKLDALLSVTIVLLSCGLLFGALWAKEAWGSYWTWDPKETWAFLTWACYVGVLHHRRSHPGQELAGCRILTVAWVVLMLAWFAVGYLPGGANSVHVYTR
jgi:ABC-type transport system involved in cytochrome c biogenesis permease subunit